MPGSCAILAVSCILYRMPLHIPGHTTQTVDMCWLIMLCDMRGLGGAARVSALLSTIQDLQAKLEAKTSSIASAFAGVPLKGKAAAGHLPGSEQGSALPPIVALQAGDDDDLLSQRSMLPAWRVRRSLFDSICCPPCLPRCLHACMHSFVPQCCLCFQ